MEEVLREVEKKPRVLQWHVLADVVGHVVQVGVLLHDLAQKGRTYDLRFAYFEDFLELIANVTTCGGFLMDAHFLLWNACQIGP